MVNVNIPMYLLLGSLILVGLYQFNIIGSSSNRAKSTKLFLGLAILGGALMVPAIAGVVTDFGVPLEFDLGGDNLPLVASPTNVVVPTTSGFCPPGQQVEDTTVTLSSINKYNQTATGETHRYRIDGGASRTVSDAGTFTASPGNNIEILFGNGAPTTAHFGALQNVVVPCDGTIEYTAEVIQNGTVGIDVFNEEGNLISTADNVDENETLAAGDVVTIQGKVKGTFERGIPYGGILVVEYNTTEIDDVIIQFAGRPIEEVSTPSVLTVANTDHKFKTFVVPPFLSNEILDFTVTIDADDTTNPGAVDDIDLRLRVNNYYVN